MLSEVASKRKTNTLWNLMNKIEVDPQIQKTDWQLLEAKEVERPGKKGEGIKQTTTTTTKHSS